MRLALAAIVLAALVSHAHAWSECGHHLVALIAYDLLPEDQQQELARLLHEHPRWAEDFDPSPNVRDVERYQVGLSGYWPDIARSQPKYNRPTWHYELGPAVVIGDESKLQVHERPGPLPDGATLETQELYVSQAIELCRRVLGDQEAPESDRALAICWLAHLVGDSHQPLHAGSLYAPGALSEGDRGGNSIPTAQSRNLHALWDGLLGRRFDEGDIAKRQKEALDEFEERGKAVAESLDPLVWLEESREAARRVAYTPDVLHAVGASVIEGLEEPPQVRLTEDYLQTAGRMARLRVVMAGYRLAGVWGEGLQARAVLHFE